MGACPSRKCVAYFINFISSRACGDCMCCTMMLRKKFATHVCACPCCVSPYTNHLSTPTPDVQFRVGKSKWTRACSEGLTAFQTELWPRRLDAAATPGYSQMVMVYKKGSSRCENAAALAQSFLPAQPPGVIAAADQQGEISRIKPGYGTNNKRTKITST